MQKTNNKHNAEDKFSNIQLNTDEFNALIKILDFSILSADFMAKQEAVKGAYTGEQTMIALSHNAKKILAIIVANMQIGTPVNDLPC